MSQVIIVGGGAAGMYAALISARLGHQVKLLEQNEKLGKKILITGKGRCNLTNSCDTEGLFASVSTNPRFLYSSFYRHNSQDTMRLFTEMGLSLKEERGGRVFPVSDKSLDVVQVLERELKTAGVRIFCNTKVKKILVKNGTFQGVELSSGKKMLGEVGMIATGGLSYPTTGSTGDGYRFAKELGHQIEECIPSLVSIEVEEDWVSRLQGLSLKNVGLTVEQSDQVLYKDQGEMLFTNKGISGPLTLRASSRIGRKIQQKPVDIFIDLKPAMSVEILDKRILRDFQEQHKKQFKNGLHQLYPNKLIPIIIERSQISPTKPIHLISKEERKRLLSLTKKFKLQGLRLGGFKEAVITKGGVSTKEISPKTMESKLVSKLHFIGEVLDVDSVTGGYNLQIAWSTAYTAATSVN